MQRIRFALLAALAVPAFALAQAGRVLMAVGEVSVVRGAQELRLGAGAAIGSGDTIRLGPNSNAQIRMSDESIISLRERTVFRIDEYVYSGKVDGSEKSLFSLLAGGMRAVTGVIGNLRRTEKYAVRTPTSTIGIRGTHYTLRECNEQSPCGGTGARAGIELASAAASPGDVSLVAQILLPGQPEPRGTFGGITDGGIGVTNDTPEQEFKANQFFHVADRRTPPQALIGPPPFLFDVLLGQLRSTGLKGRETGETIAQGGVNAESRPSTPPLAKHFGGSDTSTSSPAAPSVSPAVETPAEPATQTPPSQSLASTGTPTIAGVGAFFDSGGMPGEPGDGGGFFTTSNLMLSGAGNSTVLLGFMLPAGFLAEPGGGNFAVTGSSSGTVINETVPNSLNANWGRWTGGSLTELDSSPTPNPVTPTNHFHYLIGPLAPPEVIAAKTGSFSLFVVQGTTPTNNIGELGSFSAPGWGVNFTSRIVFAPAGTGFSFPTQGWTFAAFSTPIRFAPGKGAFIDAVVAGSCGGDTCAGTANLGMTGIFMGSNGDHLGVGFNARTTTGPAAHASTAKIFTCSPHC